MELSKVQNRFIKQKSVGYQMVKGKNGTGKSTSSVFRTINLENNYCIYAEDKILFLTSKYSKVLDLKKLYKEKSEENHFYSLFSLEKDRVNISTLEQIINTYSNAYKRKNGLSLKVIEKDIIKKEFNRLESDIDTFSKKSKIIKKASLETIINEVLWIKASNFSREDYYIVDRKGRGNSIKKNSVVRQFIYDLKEKYNQNLFKMGYMDKYDHVLFAIEYMKKQQGVYSHIIIDDCEKLTKAEIDLIKELYANKDHSSLIFILNTEYHNEENSWLIKGRKLKTLGEDFKGKTYSFKTKFIKEDTIKEVNSISKYRFVNLKNKSQCDFKIDNSNSVDEIFIEDSVCADNEIEKIPVFNNIAAGNPIELNDNIEGMFILPKYWIGKGKDVFILTVQGDSMVDKNICNGDYIVIKKQQTANHNDIVAASLDGEVTLKTLNLNGEEPLLMPANNLYSPISIKNKETTILGIAIGIIKNTI